MAFFNSSKEFSDKSVFASHTHTHTQKGFLNVELRKKSDSKKIFFSKC